MPKFKKGHISKRKRSWNGPMALDEHHMFLTVWVTSRNGSQAEEEAGYHRMECKLGRCSRRCWLFTTEVDIVPTVETSSTEPPE